MQELRINQYGQYIQEKLGLLRKPKAIEIMINNFRNDPNLQNIRDKSLDSKNNDEKSKTRVKLHTYRQECLTNSPENTKSFMTNSNFTRQSRVLNTRHGKIKHKNVLSSDYDDGELGMNDNDFVVEKLRKTKILVNKKSTSDQNNNISILYNTPVKPNKSK